MSAHTITSRLEAIALRLEAIASRLGAIATRVEASTYRCHPLLPWLRHSSRPKRAPRRSAWHSWRDSFSTVRCRGFFLLESFKDIRTKASLLLQVNRFPRKLVVTGKFFFANEHETETVSYACHGNCRVVDIYGIVWKLVTYVWHGNAWKPCETSHVMYNIYIYMILYDYDIYIYICVANCIQTMDILNRLQNLFNRRKRRTPPGGGSEIRQRELGRSCCVSQAE